MNNKDDDFNLEERMKEEYSNVDKEPDNLAMLRAIEVGTLIAAIFLFMCSSDHKWLIVPGILCIVAANVSHHLWRQGVYQGRRDRRGRDK